MSNRCIKCKSDKDSIELKTLKCNHTFCWLCLKQILEVELKIKYKCPVSKCSHFLKDHEVKQILRVDLVEVYDNLCLNKLSNGHTCILPGCLNVSVYDNVNTQYRCSNCGIYNCVQCNLAHKDMICGDKVSRISGETLDSVCQNEINAAKARLQVKKNELNRIKSSQIDKNVLIPNYKIFKCKICERGIGKGDGIMLRNCFRNICRDCLKSHVNESNCIPVPCPFDKCTSSLDDRECRMILTACEEVNYNCKSLVKAARRLEHPENCRGVNCSYLCDRDHYVRRWSCPLCYSENCVDCNAVHRNQTCKQYMDNKVECKADALIEEKIRKKLLMRCPNCSQILKKSSGCNWIKCPNCCTELCWITQTYRWGPKGKGDISAGCRCLVGNQFCHPDCIGCQEDAYPGSIPDLNLLPGAAVKKESSFKFGSLKKKKINQKESRMIFNH